MRKSFKQLIIFIVGTCAIVAAGWCGWHAWKRSQERAEIKADYSTLNNITYGLLSVNAWRDHGEIDSIYGLRILQYETAGAQMFF